MVTYRPWTAEEKQRLADLVAAGKPISAIVKALGRNSPGSIRFAMRSNGIEHRSNRWTDAENEELRQLAAQGLTAAAIAALMPGRTRTAILRRRREMGLAHLYRRARREPAVDLADTGEL